MPPIDPAAAEFLRFLAGRAAVARIDDTSAASLIASGPGQVARKEGDAA
jgi:hypothetical protein